MVAPAGRAATIASDVHGAASSGLEDDFVGSTVGLVGVAEPETPTGLGEPLGSTVAVGEQPTRTRTTAVGANKHMPTEEAGPCLARVQRLTGPIRATGTAAALTLDGPQHLRVHQ